MGAKREFPFKKRNQSYHSPLGHQNLEAKGFFKGRLEESHIVRRKGGLSSSPGGEKKDD